MLYHSFIPFFHAYLDTSTSMHNMTHPHLCIPWHIHLYAYHHTSTSMHTITHPPLCIQWHIHAFHDAFIQLTHAYNGTSTHTITQYKQRDSWNVRFCNFLYNAYINKFAINENSLKIHAFIHCKLYFTHRFNTLFRFSSYLAYIIKHSYTIFGTYMILCYFLQNA